MASLLNPNRPPFFCPGCSHDRVVKALDQSFQKLGLEGNKIAIVTDIGCSGLFDTFFNTHALHGLHGRALTYATGLKLACPALTVIVIMGDGGLGIGGAHVLSSCRRNLDINLLVLNNFNYGMTGGQCSATTPVEASTASGFLSQLEDPLDICAVGAAAGAAWIDRVAASDSALPDRICQAINSEGFALMDITGICPGRLSKKNRHLKKLLDSAAETFSEGYNPRPGSTRVDYGVSYRNHCAEAKTSMPLAAIQPLRPASLAKPMTILFLGAAGQRVNTAAEILCLSALHGGLHATQKNDYPITVLRGFSISEVVLSPQPIQFTGIQTPDIILALAAEGIARKQKIFSQLPSSCLIVQNQAVMIPDTKAGAVKVDFAAHQIPSHQGALALLALLPAYLPGLTRELLYQGLESKFTGSRLAKAQSLVKRCLEIGTAHQD